MFWKRSRIDIHIHKHILVELSDELFERGAFSAKGPDSSVDGVSVGYCPDDVHMEEEVQVKVQVEEEEIGEKHGKEPGEETIKSHTWMTM